MFSPSTNLSLKPVIKILMLQRRNSRAAIRSVLRIGDGNLFDTGIEQCRQAAIQIQLRLVGHPEDDFAVAYSYKLLGCVRPVDSSFLG